MKRLGKYSIGLGDRFGRQGSAQLKAVMEAGKKGVDITPVWNKSNREHTIIGTQPGDVRTEADTVTANAGFEKPYFVDADHINLDTVGRFIESSDFFTIDVASYIGRKADQTDIEKFINYAAKYADKLEIPGVARSIICSRENISEFATKYLFAARKAGEIYREIAAQKGRGNFITEVSMDEVAIPQSPIELFFILAMLAQEEIPVQTIAPKFSGRFNKGVDYAGDPLKFAGEFEEDLLVISYAVTEFGLPDDLKISVHSGSDKFSIYGHIGSLSTKHNAGVHVKTAGTTWLEEVIGLAEAEGEALQFVKDLYVKSLEKIDELCAPYADVIDINTGSLPTAHSIRNWDGKKFADALRHIPGNYDFNTDMRQLIHVAYKLAAEKMDTFASLLEEHKDIVARCVYENIYNRHICRLFDIC